jgi:hypothetical protein
VNEPLTVSLETLAAQAMGEVDAVSGDLVPPIHMSTIYERQTDGSYHQDRVYTRAYLSDAGSTGTDHGCS